MTWTKQKLNKIIQENWGIAIVGRELTQNNYDLAKGSIVFIWVYCLGTRNELTIRKTGGIGNIICLLHDKNRQTPFAIKG